jgi:RNA polymerase sigma-70 factor (ECF subfamily)
MMRHFDTDILKQLKKGDMSSFDEIYYKTNKAVYYAAYLILKDEDSALDIMQETYLQFLNNIKKIPLETEIVAYLTTTSKNKAINLYNRKKKEKEFAYLQKDYSFSSLEYNSGLIDVIKSTLNEKEFYVFMLKVIGGYSFKEISVLKNIPLGTATWLYQEARKKLEIKLKGAKN